jgi:hypothetical protein
MKEIIYKLPYEDNGKMKNFDFKISFVPHGFIKLYNEILADSFRVKNAWDAISDLNTKIGALSVEKPTDYKKQISKIEEEKTSLFEQIASAAELEIEKRRFDALSILLKKNGYNQEFLHDFKFWEWQVEPIEIINFMSTCAFKDIDYKKKAVI